MDVVVVVVVVQRGMMTYLPTYAGLDEEKAVWMEGGQSAWSWLTMMALLCYLEWRTGLFMPSVFFISDGLVEGAREPDKGLLYIGTTQLGHTALIPLFERPKTPPVQVKDNEGKDATRASKREKEADADAKIA
ncbi:hypothetical protein L249_2375 [Ophiocordyceps polyrhachis-furcata BCC 54312]|uniref:Uncharacterized protein n=1 Tax=Ophiocordyceps polyrhachis-furcata BCC 54312 TaxID=1330021 RepID=A0A367LP85_9HYPO|nr:hypothetical protein L249_2375 [Ophiocordyceps polyrhachis-furcata BCC 54312]